jgi:hypothetical protein
MARTLSYRCRLLCCAALLAAGGCTGTDFLDTGYSTVQLQVAVTGTPLVDFDCLLFELGNVTIRPLDGVCDANSATPGDPCLLDSDCQPGACEGSLASETVPGGIVATLDSETLMGDLRDGPCDPQNATYNQAYPELATGVWTTPLPFVLTRGLYEISTSDVRNLRLYKDDLNDALVDLRQCANQSNNMAQHLGEDALRFTVSGSSTVIRYEVNIAAIEQLFSEGDSNNCEVLRDEMPEIIDCVTCDPEAAP